MKYRTRNVTIEATQWMKMGDHPNVIAGWMRSDGQCFDHKPLGGPSIEYPVIKTLEGWHGVSPLDYIITGLKGEHYPCKPDVFDMKYQCAENARFFQDDSEWQRHCKKMASRVADAEKTVSQINSGLIGWHEDALPEAQMRLHAARAAMRSGGSWDGRDDHHQDYLDIMGEAARIDTSLEAREGPEGNDGLCAVSPATKFVDDVMSNYPDNFNSKAFDRHWGDAGPRDTFQDDLNAAFRRSFEALKGDIEGICYRANVDVKPDLEAFEYFKDGCDNAFMIDWRMTRDE